MSDTLRIVARLMRSHGAVRRSVQLFAGICAVLNAILAAYLALKATQLTQALEFLAFALACAGAVGAGVLLIYAACDETPSELVEKVSEMDLMAVRNQELLASIASEELYRKATQNAMLAMSSNSSEASIEVTGMEMESPREAIAKTLDLIAEHREVLFGMTNERWTFSVYLLHDGELRLLETRRWSRQSETAPHRSWSLNEGYVGRAFSMGRVVTCPDTADPEILQYLTLAEEKRRPADSDIYVSYAAVPVRLGERGTPLGILMATSDCKGRFSAGQVARSGAWYPKAGFPLVFAAQQIATVVTARDAEDVWHQDGKQLEGNAT